MYKFTKKQIKEAVQNSNGTYTSVAKNLGCRSSVTSQSFVKKYPDIEKEFKEIQRKLCDKAMNTITDKLESKNEFVAIKAAEFILRNMPESPCKEQTEDTQAQLIKLLDKMINSAES